MPNGLISSMASGFVSNIFKAPQTKNGFEKLRSRYLPEWETRTDPLNRSVYKFFMGEPMIAEWKQICCNWVREASKDYTKAQKKDIEEHLSAIQIIPVPLAAEPITTHTLSASFNTAPLKEGIKTSQDPNELVTSSAIATKQDTKQLLIFGGLSVLLFLVLTKGAKGGKL